MYQHFVIVIYIFISLQLSACVETEWTGRWFPDKEEYVRDSNQQAHGGIPMGPVHLCDDGQANLDVDYNGSVAMYTCFGNRMSYLPNRDIHPVLENDHIPRGYSAPHYCMNETILYRHKIPSFGGHRPVWPKYGEYKYVPPQRWLHNLEHGAVVMLYHPCAAFHEVKNMKDIVRNCMYRHIITPCSDLTPERPLALITWGHKLFLSKFSPHVTIRFISTFANHAPEKTVENGDYELELIQSAQQVSNQKDNAICAKFTDVDHL